MEKHEARDDRTRIYESVGGSTPVQVTLTYHRPEHDEELMLALNASKYLSVLWEMDRWLRNAIKYGEDVERAKHLQDARNHFFETLEDQGVSLE